MATEVIRGIGVGTRRALGRAHVYTNVVPAVQRVQINDIAAEIGRLSASAERARDTLQGVVDILNKKKEEHSAEILSAQMEFLSDPEYYDAIVNKITEERINAEAAIGVVCDAIVSDFLQLEDEYFRERASDVKDMSNRLVADLCGISLRSLAEIDQEVIVVAEDLLPSDTAQLNPDFVLAFCTEKGTLTSHTALLANSLGIPAVVGCGKIDAKNDDMVIIDGAAGTVHIHPSDAEIADARAQIDVEAERERARVAYAQKPAVTQDGVRCNVYANIASAVEAKKALEYGAEGSGLLRTEFFFYKEDTLPTEKRQFEMYAEIARIIGAKPITVRTLDIGGDKPLTALQKTQTKEANPFLGVRGIRLTDTVPDLLAAQVRALIRVGTECDAQIKIMFPFISIVDEIKRLRDTVDKLYTEMSKKSGAEHTRPQVGAMIEIPSAALVIDHILRYVDFVSIGTNDLTQYTLAVDRTNERVSDLADYCNPAVLRLIDSVLRAGERAKKEVSVCGEMAGDLLVIPLLYGMGLSIYSMSAVRIPQAKEIVSKLRRTECAELSKRCLEAETTTEVRGYLQEFCRECLISAYN